MNAVLEIRHYGKMYGNGKKAADNVNITVQPGEIYGFIGHNGAGKTTTIRAVVGVLDFVEGEILINGHSIKKEPIVCKAQTAYIPDNPDIYDFLTGMQYLDYMGAVFQVDTQTKKQRIQKYAELLGMTEDLGELIGSLPS